MPASPVPAEILALLTALRAAGYEAVLVGGCVRDRLRGEDAHDWDVATSASGSGILEVFLRAVPIGGVHGTAMVPTACGPVDVTPFRAATLHGDLARRDFSINAIAWDPESDTWWDPAGGRADLAAGVLRATGSAENRLAEDPLRAIRAARLVASLGLRPDDELTAGLANARDGLLRVAAERVRAELDRLLEAPACADGATLLRKTGLEAALLPDTRPDAIDLLRILPPDRDLRLAAWLRGTRAESLLARWRFPKARAREVARILSAHPVDLGFRHDSGARRLRRRAGSETTLERMFALRRAELDLDGADTGRLDELETALARTAGNALGVADLALDGRQVGRILDVGPGPIVGRALRHLVECVIEDAAANTPDRLEELLRAWHAEAER